MFTTVKAGEYWEIRDKRSGEFYGQFAIQEYALFFEAAANEKIHQVNTEIPFNPAEATLDERLNEGLG